MMGKKRYKKIRDEEYEDPAKYLVRIKYEKAAGKKNKEEKKEEVNINKVVVLNESLKDK